MPSSKVDKTWALWQPTLKTASPRIVEVVNWNKSEYRAEVLIDGQTSTEALKVELYPMLGLIPGDLGPLSEDSD